MKQMRQRLASFCSCRYPSHPAALSPGRSTRKTSQDFGLGCGRGETGFFQVFRNPFPLADPPSQINSMIGVDPDIFNPIEKDDSAHAQRRENFLRQLTLPLDVIWKR
jgi:hypothetical protein